LIGKALKEVGSVAAQHVWNHCAKNLEDFIAPKFRDIRESIPRTLTGNINKRELIFPTGRAQ
jgi:hypothetical protein